jgi:hypothetical protein
MSPVRLEAAGKVKVTVASAPAFAGVRARWVGEGDAPPPVMQMLRKGKGTLDGLRAGPWEIEFDGPDTDASAAGGAAEGSRKRRVDVVAGQTIEVEL